MSNMSSEPAKECRRTSKGICYCDLDGVFVPYPECWLEFIEGSTGKHFDSLDEAKKGLAYADYVSLKKDYRSSEFKYAVAPRKGSAEFTRYLFEEGWFMTIVTTRPANYPQLLIRTVRWLERNGILFDDIIFCENKVDVLARYPDLAFGVEDETSAANFIAASGCRVFLMSNACDVDESLHSNVTVVSCFEDIIGALKE